MNIIYMKLDTSNGIGNRVYYFSGSNTMTGNYTFNQAEMIKKAMKDLGYTVIDETC